jgi:large subunit ribosomal protein L22
MAAVATEQKQTVRAQAKYVRSSARKARLVTDLIRGRSVPEARTILKFSDRAVARDVERVLHSAVANAESRPDLLWSGDDLRIAAAYADEGPTLKRHRARARGRVGRIMKRTCHITIELVPVPVAAGAAPETRAGRRRTARTEEPTLDTTEVNEAEQTESPEPEADATPGPEPQAQDTGEGTEED